MVDIKKKYNTSSLIITHDMNCVHLASDRVVILVDGVCYANASYPELNRNQDPKVKQFFDSH